jgi:serine/threonine protein kinase
VPFFANSFDIMAFEQSRIAKFCIERKYSNLLSGGGICSLGIPLRLKRQKLSVRDFEPLSMIGNGSMGEVWLVRDKKGEILALKKMHKENIIRYNAVQRVLNEKIALVETKSCWVVDLKCAFQDIKFVYLVMEYMPISLDYLIYGNTLLVPEKIVFYLAEIVMATEYINKMGYMHRDLKPENILLSKSGHVKLADFGLCKYTANRFRCERTYSRVGTPDLWLLKLSLAKHMTKKLTIGLLVLYYLK